MVLASWIAHKTKGSVREAGPLMGAAVNYAKSVSVQFLACEMEKGSAKKKEHDEAKQVVLRQRTEHLGADGEQIGSPGQAKYGGNPAGNMVGDFRVLQKIDDNTQQAKDAARGDQSAGVKRARARFAIALLLLLHAGFYGPPNEASSKHSGSGGDGDIHPGGKGERTYSQDFDCDDQGDTHQDEAPRQALVENS